MSNTPLLRLNNIRCTLGSTEILPGLSFDLQPGEIACLLGASGCGKTTALRVIAGFVEPNSGTVELNSREISAAGAMVPPESRGIGMVFQDYALFPHLSVAANVAFGLGRLDKSSRDATVTEMLALVGLADKADAYPHELSGGQQQRVALARALAPKPDLLLLDEPFSNLDADLRRQLSLEMKQILKRAGIAAILVTHDQQEAFTLSDKVGVIIGGKIQQWGTPSDLFYKPATPEIARFLSMGALVDGLVCDEACLETELGIIEFAEPVDAPIGETVSIYLRPLDLELTDKPMVPCTIEQIEFQGVHTLYHLKTRSGQTLQVAEQGISQFETGQQVGVHVNAHRPLIFARS